jgi:tetratricopeptide (TPR) repeat protein
MDIYRRIFKRFRNGTGISGKSADVYLRDQAYAEFQKGLELFGPSHRKEAESHFRAAIALNPGEGVFHLRLATTLEALGNKDEAKTEYEEAIILLPGEGMPHFCLGNMLRSQGNYLGAAAKYTIALQLNLDQDFRNLCSKALAEVGRVPKRNFSTDPKDLANMIISLRDIQKTVHEVHKKLMSNPIRGEINALMMMPMVFQYLKEKVSVPYNSCLEQAKEMFSDSSSLQILKQLELGAPDRSYDINDLPMISRQFETANDALDNLIGILDSRMRGLNSDNK